VNLHFFFFCISRINFLPVMSIDRHVLAYSKKMYLFTCHDQEEVSGHCLHAKEQVVVSNLLTLRPYKTKINSDCSNIVVIPLTKEVLIHKFSMSYS
jgi:hypothetical protein